jgi:hypothetical protein
VPADKVWTIHKVLFLKVPVRYLCRNSFTYVCLSPVLCTGSYLAPLYWGSRAWTPDSAMGVAVPELLFQRSSHWLPYLIPVLMSGQCPTFAWNPGGRAVWCWSLPLTTSSTKCGTIRWPGSGGRCPGSIGSSHRVGYLFRLSSFYLYVPRQSS